MTSLCIDIVIYTHSNKHVINKVGFYNLELMFYLIFEDDRAVYQGDLYAEVTWLLGL